MVLADADELLFCPQGSESLGAQKKMQQGLMAQFHSRGVEEMRFVRIPYAGRLGRACLYACMRVC